MGSGCLKSVQNTFLRARKEILLETQNIKVKLCGPILCDLLNYFFISSYKNWH
jgi:hypothetical protein